MRVLEVANNMNGKLVCRNVAGYAADAIGVSFDHESGVSIGELRFSHQAHLQFINGRTLAALLSGSSLEVEDGVFPLGTPTKFDLPCHLHDVPYSMFNVLVPLLPKEERA